MTVRASRRHPVPPDDLTWEPAQRHVRGELDGVTVVDSPHPVLVWEPAPAVPVPLYAFPAAAVRTDLLVPAATPGSRPGAGAWFDLRVGDSHRDAIAWRYENTGELDGLIAFDWFRRGRPGLDHWFEEDEEIVGHPRDPYKRVDALPTSRHVVVRVDGEVVADTTQAVAVFETRMPVRWYLPAQDVRLDALTVAAHTTVCPYKGVADAFTAAGGDTPGRDTGDTGGGADDIAWRYREPLPAVRDIRDRIAFYAEHPAVEIEVGSR
ncbi:DUF427 domain-containing protein [Jatrophihabitans fulvus]